jgi:hypothetical protein
MGRYLAFGILPPREPGLSAQTICSGTTISSYSASVR